MADHTAIEWTDATWNPITGCSVVSPGCTNCYAMRLAGTRLQHHPSRADLTTDTRVGPVWNGQVRLNEQWLDQPLRWKRPRRIFVCAHGDLFHEAVPDEWIDKVIRIMGACEDQGIGHVFQILTKRADRMRDYFRNRAYQIWNGPRLGPERWPASNIWLGISAEDAPRLSERAWFLANTPAAVRFLSLEPLLSEIGLTEVTNRWGTRWNVLTGQITHAVNGPHKIGGINWVIAGGESGPGARPMHPDWIRSLRDQCAAAGTPFFFKQWGEWLLGEDSGGTDYPRTVFQDGTDFIVASDGHDIILSSAWDHRGAPKHLWEQWWADGNGNLAKRSGKKAAGALLDGREHREMPA